MMKHFFRKFLKVVSIFILVVLVSVTTFIIILFAGGFGKIPTKNDLLDLKNENASLILSQEGVVFGKFFDQNRTNVPYDSLPQHLVNALIATEDARFYQHKGIDKRAMLRVLFKTIMLGDRGSGGGSTLSQQLAKNLYGRKDFGKVTIVVNKLKEIILANRLEDIYTKKEIIELYFNTVPFGENVYGIEVASQRFFSTSVHQLKIEEAAVLVGMLKANTSYNPRLHPQNSLKRRQVVLHQMKIENYINQQEYDSLVNLDLNINYANLTKQTQAPYSLLEIEKELKGILAVIEKDSKVKYAYKKDGLKIHTSLNYQLQSAGQKAFRKHLSKMQNLLNAQYKKGTSKQNILALAKKVARQNKLNLSLDSLKKRDLFEWSTKDSLALFSLKDSLVHTLKQLHAGLLAINPQNGAIQCYVGGIDFNYYPYDQISAKRQMASTFKPILYTEAIRTGRSACDYLSNEPIVLNDYDDWSPSNYDGKSGGSYSLAAALANSKNLPTIHLYFETDLEELQQLWSDLGFLEKLNEGPSVILGTNSVSLMELVKAYAVFANDGHAVEPYFIESIEDKDGKVIYKRQQKEKEKVLNKEVTDQLNEILVKAINEGTGASIRSRYNIKIPMAGKTGTSQNYADAWFVGYNSDLVIASRVGASYPSVHFNNGLGSGGTLALPLVALTLQEVLKKPSFNRQMMKAQLNTTAVIDCEDFKDGDFIDGLFNIFKKKETSLENERKRAKRKKKIKGFFKSVFKEKE